MSSVFQGLSNEADLLWCCCCLVGQTMLFLFTFKQKKKKIRPVACRKSTDVWKTLIQHFATRDYGVCTCVCVCMCVQELLLSPLLKHSSVHVHVRVLSVSGYMWASIADCEFSSCPAAVDPTLESSPWYHRLCADLYAWVCKCVCVQSLETHCISDLCSFSFSVLVAYLSLWLCLPLRSLSYAHVCRPAPTGPMGSIGVHWIACMAAVAPHAASNTRSAASFASQWRRLTRATFSRVSRRV